MHCKIWSIVIGVSKLLTSKKKVFCGSYKNRNWYWNLWFRRHLIAMLLEMQSSIELIRKKIQTDQSRTVKKVQIGKVNFFAIFKMEPWEVFLPWNPTLMHIGVKMWVIASLFKVGAGHLGIRRITCITKISFFKPTKFFVGQMAMLKGF